MRRVPGACSSSSRPRWRRLPIRCSRSEEHTSELQSLAYLVCRLLLEKKKKNKKQNVREQKQRNKHRNMFYKHHTNQQPTIPRTVHNHESRISYQIALVDTRATMSNAT